MSLLDYLAQKTDCIALSELRDASKHEQVLTLLKNDKFPQFSLQEWNYALSYILGTKLSLSSQADLIQYFSTHTPTTV